MKRTEKGRIETYKIRMIAQILKQANVPYLGKGKKRNDPDLLFVIKGVGYTMNLENAVQGHQETLNIRINRMVYQTQEKEEYKKTFPRKNIEEQQDWIALFIKEQQLKGLFAEEPHYYTKMILTYSLPTEYAACYEKSKLVWMKKLHLETADQLELYVLDTGMRRCGEAREKVYYEGRGIKATMEIKNKEPIVKILQH